MTAQGVRISLSVVIVIFGLMVLPDLTKALFKKISNVQTGLILLVYVITAAMSIGLIFG